MSPAKTNTISLHNTDATTIHLSVYPTRSKRSPLQLIKTFIQLSQYHGYKSSILWVDEGVELAISVDFMQLCVDHEYIVETIWKYDSSINWKVYRPHQTMNNMFCIQLLSCGQRYDLWCVCYQYTIWIISWIINRCLGISTIFAWHNHKNVFYTIPFT